MQWLDGWWARMKDKQLAVDPHCRFCTNCEIWQTLRSKHCRSCQQCVAMYDHHCIWMGNCIGERNHACFWWFLFTESALSIWAIYEIAESFESGHDIEDFLATNAFAIVTGAIVVL